MGLFQHDRYLLFTQNRSSARRQGKSYIPSSRKFLHSVKFSPTYFLEKFIGPTNATLISCRAEQKESKKVEKVAKAPEAEANGDAKAVKNGDSKKEKKEEPKKEEPKKEEANKKEKEEKPKEKEVPKAKELPKVEEKEEVISTPLVARPAQNWSDLFFIIDSLSYNIDACDLILFMTKINPIPGLENKKVNVDVSYLDTTSNTLVISHTDSGIIESLLGEMDLVKYWCKSFTNISVLVLVEPGWPNVILKLLKLWP